MDYQQKNKAVIIISLVSITASLLVISGWIFNNLTFKEIVPGFSPMVFNTALSFILYSTALLSAQYQGNKYQSRLFLILSFTGSLIGLVTLLEFMFHFNAGLDQLFVADHAAISAVHPFPGRMAYNAAVCIFLLGTGLLMLSAKRYWLTLTGQYLFHAVSIISAIALIGYLYGVSLFDTVFYVSSMATHTAMLFFALSIAASLLNPSMGITSLFTGNLVGNQMAKRLFALMLLMVVIFGSLRLQTQYFRVYTLNIGIPLLAVCFLLAGLLLIWNTANWLNKIDVRRSEAEAKVKLMNAGLEKRVEERSAEYQKSEQKYRSLIEQASDAIYVLDHQGYFTDVNASMCKMVGYSREELLQLNVEAIIDPDELKTDPLPKNMGGERGSVIRERRFRRNNGLIFTVEVNVKTFADNMVLVIARDISSRKKMEAELREAELKFRTIAEKSMVGVYIVKNGKFTYVNPRFAAVFGYEPAELMNTVPVETIIDEKYKHITTENVRARIAGEVESTDYEVIGKRKDGTTNWVEFYGSRAIIDGEPTIIGSMIDITERREAEEELRSSEQKYKLIFESNPLPLWMISKEDQSVIAVNEVAANLYGYTQDELLQMRTTQLLPKEDVRKQLQRYGKDAATATDLGIVKHKKKDGTIMFVQITAHDIIFEGKPVRLSLTNDVTEKLRAEESLRQSEAHLQTILNTTDTAYASFDAGLRVLAFNQKSTEFFNEQFHHAPAKGDRLTDYFPKEKSPNLYSLQNRY